MEERTMVKYLGKLRLGIKSGPPLFLMLCTNYLATKQCMCKPEFSKLMIRIYSLSYPPPFNPLVAVVRPESVIMSFMPSIEAQKQRQKLPDCCRGPSWKRLHATMLTENRTVASTSKLGPRLPTISVLGFDQLFHGRS